MSFKNREYFNEYRSMKMCPNEITPLPDNDILDWSIFKQIADNISKCI